MGLHMSEPVPNKAQPLPPPRQIPLITLPSHNCNYLPGRVARSRGFLAERMPAELYHAFMDVGFRRSGRLVYQPVCPACRMCRPIRVPVQTFAPSKSQKRAWKRNQDVVVSVESPPTPTQEKFDLYERYVTERHGREDDATPEAFVTFLYESPVDTLEFTYRDAAGKLIGVGICDVCPRTSLSSVYFYFDPDESKRGLGTFSAVWEIDYCRRQQIPHYYLGYWIAGCGTMQYKSDFRPHEILGEDGLWRAGQTPEAVG
jgi:arginine-tRNA-protein transferase